MICMQRNFGTARDGAAREHRAQHLHRSEVRQAARRRRSIRCGGGADSSRTPMNSSARTVPGRQIRPRSLRSRSISITCSARSLGCAISAAPRSRRCSPMPLRARVPAIGRVSTCVPLTRTSRSASNSAGANPGTGPAPQTGPGSRDASVHTSSRHRLDRLRAAQFTTPRA